MPQTRAQASRTHGSTTVSSASGNLGLRFRAVSSGPKKVEVFEGLGQVNLRWYGMALELALKCNPVPAY